MMRLRIAAVAAATSLAFAAVAVPAVAASRAGDTGGNAYNFRALYSVPVTGAAKNGGQTFTGKFGIQRFVVAHHQAYAVGTLTGKLGNQHVTRTGVMMPASLTGSPSGQARDAQSCPILNLVLGPIHLNLLGLVVDLGGGTGSQAGTLPITMNITAISGAGNLLGNLLCGVSNLLNTGGTLSALQGDVQSLTAALNGLLGVLSGV